MSSSSEELGPTGQPISFFSILRSLAGQLTLGTDITRIALPSIFCYPLSLLEIMAIKRMRGMDQLSAINDAEDPLIRMLLIMRWFYSSLTPDEFGKKPLNPILGETFECKSGDMHYLSEQVSHHPPISAFYFEHIPSGISYYGHAQVIAKFGGNSVAADFAGDAYLYIPKHGELYQFSYPMPTMHARGLLIGKSRNELGGEMWLECEKSGLRSAFTFKTTGMFSGTENEVVGKIKVASEKKKYIASWSGLWSTEIELSVADKQYKQIQEHPTFSNNLLFRYSDISPAQLEVVVREGAKDSRSVWGSTMAAIIAADLHKADEEKAKVENEQRARLRAKKEENGDENGGFVPVHFDKDENGVWHIKESSRITVNPPTYISAEAAAAAVAAASAAAAATTTTTESA